MGETTADRSLQRAYEAMISADVGPFLRARGFDASGSSFERERAPLYDMINFQPDWHNGTMSWHGFFVNADIGSTEVDTACPGYEQVAHPLKGSLLHHRWEEFVPDLPYEVRFDNRTDMRQLAAALCDGIDLALAQMERITTTKELARYAVDNNLLIEYDKTCRYLAAVDDIDTLTEYVTRCTISSGVKTVGRSSTAISARLLADGRGCCGSEECLTRSEPWDRRGARKRSATYLPANMGVFYW